MPGQPDSYTFEATGEASEGKRPFACTLPWLDAFKPRRLLQFPTVPGLDAPLQITLPPARCEALRVSAQVDTAAVTTDSFVVSTLQMRPKRAPVASQLRPSIPLAEALAQLRAVNYERGSASPNGDCWPLSSMAGYELTAQEARMPGTAACASVQKVRGKAIDLVAGTKAIAKGVPAQVFRAEELLPKTPLAAARAFAPWRENGFWSNGDVNKGAAFQFGVAAALKRPVAALERSGQTILDPCKIYGTRGADGKLRVAPPSAGKPATVHSWYSLPFDELIELLRRGAVLSVVLFNGSNHFDPILRVGDAAPELATTEVFDGGDVGDPDELDDGESQELPLPAGEMQPAASVTGRCNTPDALQDAARYQHLATGMSGMKTQPDVAEGSMAARSMQALALSRGALPGEGEAANELQSRASPDAANDGDGDGDDFDDYGDGYGDEAGGAVDEEELTEDAALEAAMLEGAPEGQRMHDDDDDDDDDETEPEEEAEEEAVAQMGRADAAAAVAAAVDPAPPEVAAAPASAQPAVAATVEPLHAAVGAAPAVAAAAPPVDCPAAAPGASRRPMAKARRGAHDQAAAVAPSQPRGASRKRTAGSGSGSKRQRRAAPAAAAQPAAAPAPTRSGRVAKPKRTLEESGAFDVAPSKWKSTPPRRKQARTAAALPAYCVPGARVLALGSLGGVHARFHATVIKLLADGRAHVRFDSDMAGRTNAICLPIIRSAYVGAEHLLGPDGDAAAAPAEAAAPVAAPPVATPPAAAAPAATPASAPGVLQRFAALFG